MINATQLKIMNPSAEFEEIFPAGSSRSFVLGFFASILRSAQRLKAIAAERAKTIHNKTLNAKSIVKTPFPIMIPEVNPIAANGNANTV
jgi:hypothetical protein